jgi:hypothetical protein
MMKMKIRILALLLIVWFNTSLIHGQEQLLAIDSIYLTSIDEFYKKAEKAKSEIWAGMKLAPICLFRVNGPALLFNHPSPPESFIKVSDSLYLGEQQELQLFGATQVEINGTLTAIVDYGLAHYSGQEEVYAELFHELHHVYQRNFVKQIKFDNPAVLLVYPENYLNDGLKLFEQETLYKLCFESDSSSFRKLLNQFYSCRLAREQQIGDFMKYEETVENMEGPAFYCEYKFYTQSSSISEVLKANYIEKHFFSPLTTPYYGRKSLRYRHLAAGMALCYLLDKHFSNWQAAYYSQNLSLYDFFIDKFAPQKLDLAMDSVYVQLSKFHTSQELLGHQHSFHNFISQAGIKITLSFDQNPHFKGFDPMHAESLNDSTILHKTFLKLSGSRDNEIFITHNEVATIIDKEIWFVKKVILFAPEAAISINNDRIEVDVEGKKVLWTGKLKMRTDNELFFNCD